MIKKKGKDAILNIFFIYKIAQNYKILKRLTFVKYNL